MAEQHSKTVKAKRATIDIGGIVINVYQLPDGSYRLAGRNVTDAIGMRPGSLSEVMKVKSLKDLPHADAESIQSNTGETFTPVSVPDALSYWGACAARGNTRAQSLLQYLKQDPSSLGLSPSDIPMVYASPKRSSQTIEKRIQLELQARLGGEIEVITPAGRIDLLTHQELIEVKAVKGWKEAIGQLMVYGHYYPSHQKHLHLFGAAHSESLNTIRAHCERLQIALSHESGL